MAAVGAQQQLEAADAELRRRCAATAACSRWPALPRRGGGAEHLDAPDGRRDQAEHGAEHRGLAGAVGAEHADELAGLDGEGDAGEDPAPPKVMLTLSKTIRAHSVRPASACCDGGDLAGEPGLDRLARRLGLGDADDRHLARPWRAPAAASSCRR